MELIHMNREFTKSRLLGLFIAATAIITLCLLNHASAMPASPHPIHLSQPDGTKIILKVRGDEKLNWFEDEQGFTVVRKDRTYVYATLDSNDSLRSTDYLVGKVNPADLGLQPKIIPSATTQEQLRSKALAIPALRDSPSRVPPSGTVKNLVVLCKFSDHTLGTHTRVPADYEVLMNAVGGDPVLAPTGSVRDCYLENSYGTMTLNSTVLAWVTLPHTQAYYADGSDGLEGYFPNNAQGMVRDALDLADPLVDFGDFDQDNDGYIDAIDIIHSGYGAETGGGGGDWIWSHRWAIYQVSGGKWTSSDTNGNGQLVSVFDYHTEPALWSTSGTDILRIGVVAHETGHFFGLPDYYDTDGGGEGIGSYGMMGNAWGVDHTQLHPPHFSAYSKIFLGWVTPTVISAPGIYTAPQVQTNPVVYRIDQGYPSGEFLLIENRQPVGIESALPQGGLAIWHIDEDKYDNTDEGYPGQSGWPGNNNHYRVALLQADGDYDLEKGNNRDDAFDLYHGNGINAIDETTVPNTDSYQNGTVTVTGNSITDISISAENMTFNFGNFTPCTQDSDCDDGLYCTGVEHCNISSGVCYSDGAPCSGNDLCDENNDRCLATTFYDDFETDQGWVATVNGATSGGWEMGIPVNDSTWDYDPESDSDDSGSSCYLTENQLGNTDVDNGSVILTSPTIDMSGGEVTIGYAYYLYLTSNEIGNDRLLVEINTNNGTGTWTTIALHETDGGLTWRNHVISQPDLDSAGVTPTSTSKLRFTCNDANTQSVVEGGLDAVKVSIAFDYGNGDMDDDGDVDLFDFALFQQCFGSLVGPGCEPANLASDDMIDMTDFAEFEALLGGPE